MRILIKRNEFVDRPYTDDEHAKRVRVKRTISTSASPVKDARNASWVTIRREVAPSWAAPFERAGK